MIRRVAALRAAYFPLAERGVSVDHSTIWRWVQRFAPELLFRLRPHLEPTNRSWRADETYVRVKGR